MADDDDQISIPSVVDGLTPMQRMILICAFRNPDCQQVKEFSAYVAHHSPSYRNQQQLLTATMTGMAQNYPGTNNINLLNPSGVGNRYMSTQLSSITRHIFRDLDQPLRDWVTCDYLDYPPTWLMPVIPMVLVNGSDQQGIGPKYDPHDIIANLRNLLCDKPFVPMAPRYKWFAREIPRTTETSYTIRGVIEEREHAPNRLFITELPIGKEAQDYEGFLKAAAGLKHTEPFIKEYIAHRDIINGTVTFEVVMSPDQMNKAREEGFEKKFGLTTNLDTDNMHFLDANGVRKKYDTPEQIMKEFVDLRLKCYEKRMSALFDIVDNALLQLEGLYNVFYDFRDNVLFPLINPADQVLYAELQNNYFLPSIEPPTPTTTLADVEEERLEFFDTLLSLKGTFIDPSVTDLWLEELDDLEEQLNKQKRDEDEANRRKKWICDAEVEEDKPFSEEQPPKIEDEEPSEVKCGSQVRSSSIPEDVSPPPVKRDEEDETEKRKICCWIPVSKKSKRRITMKE